MDVNLVKDVGDILDYCKQATLLEQRRALNADHMMLYNSGGWVHQGPMGACHSTTRPVLLLANCHILEFRVGF